MPIIFCLIKSIGKTAPTRILCKYLLLLGRCQTVIELKLVQEVDSRDILSELLFCSTHSDLVIGNAVVVLFAIGDLGVRVIHGKGLSRLFFLDKLRNTISVFLIVMFNQIIRDRDQHIKHKIVQLVFDQIVKRVVFAYLYDVIGKIFLDLEIHKVYNHLDGNLIIGNSRITDTDVCQIGKIHRFGIVLLGTIILYELLCDLKLCRFPARYSLDVCAVLLCKFNDGIQGLIVNTHSLYGVKVFVKCDSIVQKELIKLFAAPFITSVSCDDLSNIEMEVYIVHLGCAEKS